MRNSANVVVGIALLVATRALAGAEVGVVVETRDSAEIREVRSAPLGAEIAPSDGEASGLPLRQFGGAVLWVDQNHQFAVAQHLAMSGDGATIVAGWWLNNSRAALYATNGTGTPAWTAPITSNFFIPVDASNDGSVITGTGRQDLLYAWNAASNVPVCSEVHPGGEGNAVFTPDAGGQFAGSASIQGQASFTHAHTSPGCADLFTAPLAGGIVDGRYAADGDWIGVNSRTVVNVYNSQTGSLRGTVPIPGETEVTVGISGDGNVLAIGGFSHILSVYQWDGNQYAELWNHNIPSVTWITAVDVSDDGSTVMVGTWLASTTGLGRVLMYDVATGATPLWTNSDFGDYVDSVELSADGSRGIAGSWGRAEGTFGHVLAAFDRANPVPLFAVEDDEIPGVGSCHAVSISNDGVRAAGGGKAVHAREFGNGGYVIALDLGGVVPVTVTHLAARTVDGCGVELEWETGSPSEYTGFHVYRADRERYTAEDEVRLTHERVFPEETMGSRRTYRFADPTAECGRAYVYQLAAVGARGEERVGSISLRPGVALASAPAGRLALGQNRPNPLRLGTEIPYALGEPGAVRLSIFDGAGRAVRVVDLGNREVGAHLVPWDGRDGASHRVPSGVYFYRIETIGKGTVGETATRRLVVME